MPTNRIHVNNYASTLNESGGLSDSDTTITVTSATGLPTLSGSQYYLLTIEGGGNVEIIKVTSRSGNDLTVVRGQDGTSGTAFSDGAVISARLTREGIDSKLPDDEHVLPDTDSTYDIGEDATRWNDLWLSGDIDAEGNMQLDGNLTIDGTVDGRDVATDGTKLDGIEAAADVTDEDNVTDALDNATLTDVGTPASGDLILLQDASDTNALKVAQFSEFGGGGSAASQATMEAATDTTDFVTAGRTQYHPGVAKVWCNMDGTGTIAINTSYNMTSLTDNGTGDYTFTIATDFSTADYAVGTFCYRSGSSFNTINGDAAAAPAAGALRIQCFDAGSAVAADMDIATIVAFGDQ